MFRIVCFVEDKNLAKVLHATAGLVLNMEPPQPVTNAVISKPTAEKPVVRQVSNATSFKGRLTEYLGTIKGSRISVTDMRAKWIEFGGLETSINGSLLTQLTKEGHLKRISRGFYTAM